jgi:hypothetical protein
MEPNPSGGYALQSIEDVLGAPVDRSRVLCLADSDVASCAAALVGLANSTGGYLVVGAEIDESGRLQLGPAASGHNVVAEISTIAATIDPPLDRLVSFETIENVGPGVVTVALVRQSVYCPHLDTRSGRIYITTSHGLEVVRTRAELDALYRKGSTIQDRAERSIDGMVERLQLASFGHYGLAVIACLAQPTGAPHAAWQEQPDELASASDPFIREWGFVESMVRVRPSEIELRLEREVTGVLRVTRSGCAAAAEIRRHPPDKVLGAVEEITQRLHLLIDSVFRLLEPSEDPQVVPRLLCEGLKSTRLKRNLQGAELSEPAAMDTLLATGPGGDAREPSYRDELVQFYVAQIRSFYKLNSVAVDILSG